MEFVCWGLTAVVFTHWIVPPNVVEDSQQQGAGLKWNILLLNYIRCGIYIFNCFKSQLARTLYTSKWLVYLHRTPSGHLFKSREIIYMYWTFGQSDSNQFYSLNDPYPFVKVWLKIMHNIHCRKKGVSDWIHLFKYCNIKLLASQWFPIHYLPNLIMNRPMITKFLCTLSLFWLTGAPPHHFFLFLKTAWKQLNYRDRSFLVFNQSSVNY